MSKNKSISEFIEEEEAHPADMLCKTANNAFDILKQKGLTDQEFEEVITPFLFLGRIISVSKPDSLEIFRDSLVKVFSEDKYRKDYLKAIAVEIYGMSMEMVNNERER